MNIFLFHLINPKKIANFPYDTSSEKINHWHSGKTNRNSCKKYIPKSPKPSKHIFIAEHGEKKAGISSNHLALGFS